MSDWRAKNAVYLVTVPEEFEPQRPWDLPDELVDAELYQKNLSLDHVLGGLWGALFRGRLTGLVCYRGVFPVGLRQVYAMASNCGKNFQ